MSPENPREQVQAELARGNAALSAAKTLLETGLYYDSASRAYYAVFHYARALCPSSGEEPRSHQGVAHILNMRYVRTQLLPSDTSRLYAVLQQYRESSDYDSSFVMDLAGAHQAVDFANELIRRMIQLLAQSPGTKNG